MIVATAQAIGVPFAVATGAGAGLLSVLSWRAIRGYESSAGRVLAALAVVMCVATVYHVLLVVMPDASKTALLGGGKYVAVVGALGLAADFQRRAAIPLGSYEPRLLTAVVGVLAFAGGGLLAELFVPALVHWIHGFGALLVVAGLCSVAMGDSSVERWFDSAVRDPSRVRPREAWMRPVDDRILETCTAADLVLTPAIVAYNIDYSREEVNRRLSELERRSFVKRVDRGKYRITDRGRAYLYGSLTGRCPGQCDR